MGVGADGAMVKILRQLRDILARQGHPGQADVVDKLGHLHGSEPDTFRSLVRSVNMWGGSSAVWEVYPLGGDKARFQELIIQLADEMERAGLGTERSRFIAATFTSWLAKGI